mgnify:CR=1 FL=1
MTLNGRTTMETKQKDAAFFSDVCRIACNGLCCDPWWGIISYSVIKQGGLSSLASFKQELQDGIMGRVRRIREAYITNETPARPLFDAPERYNVVVRGISVDGQAVRLDLMAMFAFRCRFLSPEKSCLIHPSLNNGKEIRPCHCAFTGSIAAKPGEQGYCRIIDAAEGGHSAAIDEAIRIEKGSSSRHYNEGFATAEEAVSSVIERLKKHCASNAPVKSNINAKEAGRNDPCPCGNGKKYKKCHGA